MNQREKVWMGGKQPEESPEGSVGRGADRQGKEAVLRAVPKDMGPAPQP